MYMNCAAVDIQSSSTAPLTLPAVFRANTFGPSCHTVEVGYIPLSRVPILHKLNKFALFWKF